MDAGSGLGLSAVDALLVGVCVVGGLGFVSFVTVPLPCVAGVMLVGVGWLVLFIDGEFDPGSGRTLAACLTHASRTVNPFGGDQWRTGE